LGYDNALGKGNILLSESVLDASGVGGGSIQLQGKSVTLTNATILSQTLGNQNGKNVFLSASDLVLENDSIVYVSTSNSGNGGNLKIIAPNSIEIGKNASDSVGNGLYTQSLGTGAAGNLTIDTGKLVIRDGGQISSINFGTQKGGDLQISASNEIQLLGVSNGINVSSISTDSYNTGATGNLTIDTGKLIVRDGARVITSTRGGGKEGNLSISVSDYIELSGSAVNSDGSRYRVSGLFSQNSSNEASSNLKIDTGKLIIREGAGIYTSSTSGEITISFTNINPLSRLIAIASSFSIQDYTESSINTIYFNRLNPEGYTIETFAAPISTNIPDGKAADLLITASSFIELEGATPDGKHKSGLFADTYGLRNAGDLIINTPLLRVSEGAEVTVSSNDKGDSGNLYINTSSLGLDNSKLTAQARLNKDGGNINLNVKDLLLLRHNSEISTSAGVERASGNGGNININTPFIIALPSENSKISANAYSGQGGKVDIRAQSVLGITPRNKPSFTTSDITASSALGVQGQISIQQPEAQAQQGLMELPEEVVDATRKVAQICPKEPGTKPLGEFIITGRGSFPPSPLETLAGNSSANLATLDISKTANVSSIKQAPQDLPTQIIEAQAWIKTSDGNIELVTSAPTATPSTASLQAFCPTTSR
jgi:large exoprotein involved in heme utilization and adhesion